MARVCECGKSFEKAQSLNAHFSHCVIHRKGVPPVKNRGTFKISSESRRKGAERTRQRMQAGEIVPSFKGRKHSLESRAKMSASANEKNNGYVKTRYFEVFCKFLSKNVKLQGTWELLFAKKLDELNVAWSRDRSNFFSYELDGVKKRYFPDFYLPEFGKFVEIKGYWFKSEDGRIDDRRKMDLVKEQNPDASILIFESLEQISEFDTSCLGGGIGRHEGLTGFTSPT